MLLLFKQTQKQLSAQSCVPFEKLMSLLINTQTLFYDSRQYISLLKRKPTK